jgi:hypothetical protein
MRGRQRPLSPDNGTRVARSGGGRRPAIDARDDAARGACPARAADGDRRPTTAGFPGPPRAFAADTRCRPRQPPARAWGRLP